MTVRKAPRPATYDDTAPGNRCECCWCGFPLPAGPTGKTIRNRRWHKRCAVENAIMTSGKAARLNIYLRDGGYCAETGEFHGVEPYVEAYMLTPVDFKNWLKTRDNRDPWGPLWSEFYEHWTPDEIASYWFRYLYSCRVRGINRWLGPWELDHIEPLWKVAHLPDEERYWFFTMANMQTLSPEAHARKTAKEAAERGHFNRLADQRTTPKRSKRQKRLDGIEHYRGMP